MDESLATPRGRIYKALELGRQVRAWKELGKRDRSAVTIQIVARISDVARELGIETARTGDAKLSVDVPDATLRDLGRALRDLGLHIRFVGGRLDVWLLVDDRGEPLDVIEIANASTR